jgi:uncharacterized protein (TIGR02569 family)
MSVPSSVVEAWSLDGTAEPLEGGQGTSVRAGDLVLKPLSDEALVIWHAQLCDRVTASDFRLPAPVRSGDGRLVVEGWSATKFVTGNSMPETDGTVASWTAVLACSRAFHAAIADEPRPALLDVRTDRWATADNVAWNEGLPDEIGHQSRELLRGMRELILDEGLTPQVVHGDLSGNVLLSEGHPPAVIDISPYWRPASYADAIVVVDAVLWWRADPALVEVARPTRLSPAQWRSFLARALVFRLLAFDEPSRDAVEVDDQLPRYAWVLDLLRTAFPSGHSTSSDPISIRRISADDWQEWRRVRHEALSDAPQAFGSSLASWTGEGDTEERWRNRLREVPMNVLASIDGSDVGMCSLTAVENGEAELIAMWVAPGARGRGVGKALVAAVVDEARAAGSARVLLDVVAENESAVALYSACGFVDAGPAGASTRDRRMRLVLA